MPNKFNDISLNRLVNLLELLFNNQNLQSETNKNLIFIKKYYKLLINVNDYVTIKNKFLDMLLENAIDFEAINIHDDVKEIIYILYKI